MRAKIVKNIMGAMIAHFGKESILREDQSLIDLCERISDKEVNLIPTGSYHYEENDPEQWWIPKCAWEAI